MAESLRQALGQPLAVPDLVRGCVAFQYFITPPADASELLLLAGLDEVRALPGVWRVTTRAQPGQPLGPRSGTQGYLGVVYGEAASHAEVAALVTAIDATLKPIYRRSGD